jgi:hypothetical protein
MTEFLGYIISDHLRTPKLVAKSTDGTIFEKMNYDELGQVKEDSNPSRKSIKSEKMPVPSSCYR